MTALTATLPPALQAGGMVSLKGFANLPATELARLAACALRTARRWRARGRAPAGIVQLLEILATGTIGAIHAAWRDWSIGRDGKLWTPEGWHVTPGEIRTLPILHQQIAALAARAAGLEETLEQLMRAAPPLTPLTVTLEIVPGGERPRVRILDPLADDDDGRRGSGSGPYRHRERCAIETVRRPA